jgi:hypothetical protein
MMRDALFSIAVALTVVLAAHLFVQVVRAFPLTDGEIVIPIEALSEAP